MFINESLHLNLCAPSCLNVGQEHCPVIACSITLHISMTSAVTFSCTSSARLLHVVHRGMPWLCVPSHTAVRGPHSLNPGVRYFYGTSGKQGLSPVKPSQMRPCVHSKAHE
jgi:hypothetical protein